MRKLLSIILTIVMLLQTVAFAVPGVVITGDVVRTNDEFGTNLLATDEYYIEYNPTEEVFLSLPSMVVTIDSQKYRKLVVAYEKSYESLIDGDIIYIDSNNRLVTDRNLIEKLIYVNLVCDAIPIESQVIADQTDHLVKSARIVESLGNELIEKTLGNAFTGNFKGLYAAFKGDAVTWIDSYGSFVIDFGLDTAVYLSVIGEMYDSLMNTASALEELVLYNDEMLDKAEEYGLTYDEAQMYEALFKKCFASIKTSEHYICLVSNTFLNGNDNTTIDALDTMDNLLGNLTSDAINEGLQELCGKTFIESMSYAESYYDLFKSVTLALSVESKYSNYYNTHYVGILDAEGPLLVSADEVMESVCKLTGKSEEELNNSNINGSGTSNTKYSTGTYKPSEWDGLNIRSGASTSYSKVGTIASGTNFVVTQVDGNWGKTTCNGATGWVCLDYATYINSNTTTPSTGENTKNASGYVKYLNSLVGDYYETGWCQSFVYRATKNYFGIEATRPCATEAWKAFGKSSSRTDIPLGATVYFGGSNVTCEYCNQKAGHVGIYVGNNEIVHAWIGIQKNTIDWVLNQGYTYRGWGWNGNYEIPQPTGDDSSEQEPSTPIEYETIAEGTYVLNCIIQSYRYLTAKTDSNGGQVEAKAFENIDAQKFEIIKSGNGYKIISKNSTTGRAVSGYNDGAGQTTGNVTLANSSSSSSQIWLFRKEGDCYVIYPSFNTSLALTSASTGRVIVSTYTGNDDQLWKLSLQSVQPEEYTITYNANGGTDAPANQTKIYGTDLTLSSTVPERTGHTFLGWATASDATVAEYQPGDNYELNANTSLYAVWKSNSPGKSVLTVYKQTYKENETVSIEWTEATYSDYYEVHVFNAATDESIYVDWKVEEMQYSISDLAPGTYYVYVTSINADLIGQGVYFTNSNAELFTVEALEKYTITYNPNGGTGAPANQTKVHGTNLTLSSTVPERTGHTFLGWSTIQNGRVEYTAGATYSENAALTLYAIWKSNMVSVTSVTLNKPSTTLEIGSSETLTATITPSDATNKAVTWTSSDEAVATVENGVVTAVGEGTATITVTTEDSGKTATCVVTVTKPEEEKPEEPDLNTKATVTLSTETGRAGDKVSVIVSLETDELINTIGISGITYDKNILTFDSFTQYDEVKDISVLSSFDKNRMAVAIAFEKPQNFNGNLFEINFIINENAVDGKEEIDVSSVIKLDSTEIAVKTVAGSVTVVSEMLGDINHDECVDMNDAVLLLQHSLFSDIYPLEYKGSVDFTKDGYVDMNDAVLLLQYSLFPDLYPIG